MPRIDNPHDHRLLALTALAFGVACATAPLRAAQPEPAASSAAADSRPPEVRQALGDTAQAQGQARMRFLGLHIYDITLWHPGMASAADWATQPLALEIRYARALDGAQIAERSLVEMKRQGPIEAAQGDAWLARMKQLFPDVKAGDRITGLQQPGQAARFWVNGRAVGEVADALFTQRFFGIWLSPQSSEPAMREQLFGAR